MRVCCGKNISSGLFCWYCRHTWYKANTRFPFALFLSLFLFISVFLPHPLSLSLSLCVSLFRWLESLPKRHTLIQALWLCMAVSTRNLWALCRAVCETDTIHRHSHTHLAVIWSSRLVQTWPHKESVNWISQARNRPTLSQLLVSPSVHLCVQLFDPILLALKLLLVFYSCFYFYLFLSAFVSFYNNGMRERKW